MKLYFRLPNILYLQCFHHLDFLFSHVGRDANTKGETAETIPEPIQVEDSSPEPPPQKKKNKECWCCTRKIAFIPKVVPVTP